MELLLLPRKKMRNPAGENFAHVTVFLKTVKNFPEKIRKKLHTHQLYPREGDFSRFQQFCGREQLMGAMDTDN
jgi:hypothetical protein